MSQTKDVEKVKNALETFFEGLDARDATIVRQFWHPDARLFLNNAVLSTRPLSFLLGLPRFLDFEIREIKNINVHQAIAAARVDYLMPIGLHSGFFNLVKVDGQWLIANWVDHGTTKSHSDN